MLRPTCRRARSGAVVLVRRHRDLEQQHVERGAKRQHRAHAKIECERELPGFGEVIDVGDRGAGRERNGLIEQIGGDDRRAISDQRGRRFAPRRARRRALVGQRGARRDHRAEQARDRARQGDARRVKQKRPAAGQEQRKQILDEDQPAEQVVVETRAHQRGRIVEQPVDHRRQQRQQNQNAVEVERRPEIREQDRGERQRADDRDEGHVERRPHDRLLIAHSARSKSASPRGAANRTAPFARRRRSKRLWRNAHIPRGRDIWRPASRSRHSWRNWPEMRGERSPGRNLDRGARRDAEPPEIMLDDFGAGRRVARFGCCWGADDQGSTRSPRPANPRDFTQRLRVARRDVGIFRIGGRRDRNIATTARI